MRKSYRAIINENFSFCNYRSPCAGKVSPAEEMDHDLAGAKASLVSAFDGRDVGFWNQYRWQCGRPILPEQADQDHLAVQRRFAPRCIRPPDRPAALGQPCPECRRGEPAGGRHDTWHQAGAMADPDGYTLVQVNAALSYAPMIYPNPGYDP